MTPGQMRAALSLFLALTAGVAANAMLLQANPSSTAATKAATEKALQKAAVDRQKRLAGDAKVPTEAPHLSPSIINATPAQKTAQRAPDAGPIPLDELDKRAVEKPVQKLAAGPGPQAAIRLARVKLDAATPEQLPDAPDAEGDPDTIRAVQRELHKRGYGPVQTDGVPGLLTRAAIMAFEHDSKTALTGEATEALLKRLLLGASGDKSVELAAGKVRSAQAELVIRTVQQSLTTLGYQPGKTDGRVGEETERAIREFEMDQGMIPTGRVSAELFSRLARAVGGNKTAIQR